MNAMPKDKRQKVILVAILTVGALAGLWFGLINMQNRGLDELARNIDGAQRKLDTARKALAGAARLQTELNAAAAKLNAIEDGMASGDLYAWVYNTVRQFKLSYRVEIPQFSSIVEGETTLLPKFPYRQVTMSIGGTGYFHDIGKFVADFENQFPHIRIQNLQLEPTPAVVGAEREKLSFHMDIVALVKSSSPSKPR
jgi:Tfp pilus assembly protein PilO